MNIYYRNYLWFSICLILFGTSMKAENEKLENKIDSILKNLTLEEKVAMCHEQSKVNRALKELKGFQKLNLKSGKETISTINIPVSSLAYYDESISGWNLEKGDYDVYVGNASNHISERIKVRIK